MQRTFRFARTLRHTWPICSLGCRGLTSAPPANVRILGEGKEQTQIRTLVEKGGVGENATIRGWVRLVRAQKGATFLQINDGSSLAGCQVVTPPGKAKGLTPGCSVEVTGTLKKGLGSQPIELHAESVEVIGGCEESYPIQNKKMTMEYLRDHTHLRVRTNTFGAVYRVRNASTMAIHDWFQQHGFINVNTPILTTNDCEGAGEMFTVNFGRSKEEFFDQATFLTVSGQLHLETAACALNKVYTFGPTFRAENSHTRRHLAEFYMLEAELAYTQSIDDILRVVDGVFRHTVTSILDRCNEDMNFFVQRVDANARQRLEEVLKGQPMIMTYTDAIEVLQRSGAGPFVHKPEWGQALQAEHEKYLAEVYCKGSVFVVDYPMAVKPFYMRANQDGRTVACTDFLVPGVGELVGGSLREERLDRLEENMKTHGLSDAAYKWYADLRRFGSVPHGGFGMGFERLLLYVTGMANIRDVIPFPRVQGSCPY
eukprot:comp12453_c0_seq1/m.7383 comp12453_c0_seq1/g.7383  ORF comp12453_c0_seq1/g.7383 comp12453_c0_seq1/m.7383 type:complete len:484 (-) comp12453_c0_seq1:443-1894(-)